MRPAHSTGRRRRTWLRSARGGNRGGLLSGRYGRVQHQAGNPAPVPPRIAEVRPIEVSALQPEVKVVLPREADSAVDLERGAGDAPAGVRGVRLRRGGRERSALRLV